ncbi:hypothetical protein JCM3765_000716 [Sporobolomyces pararoseus]
MMQSLLASTSKRIIPSLRSTRLFATQTTTTPLAQTETSSSSEPSITPLPGSSVLPAAFQAPSPSTSNSPITRDSLSFSSQSPRKTTSPSSSSPLRSQPYKLSVYSTRNNTILTLSTSPLGPSSTPQDPHVPIAWVSAGSAGYKGASRGTYDAAVEVSLKMFGKIKDLIEPPILQGGLKQKSKGPKPTELELVWKGFGQGRDAVFRTLMGAEGDVVRSLVKRVTDATPIKIGGTRAKKRRVI